MVEYYRNCDYHLNKSIDFFTSIKVHKGHTKVNIEIVWNFDLENTLSKHKSTNIISRWQGIRTDGKMEGWTNRARMMVPQQSLMGGGGYKNNDPKLCFTWQHSKFTGNCNHHRNILEKSGHFDWIHSAYWKPTLCYFLLADWLQCNAIGPPRPSYNKQAFSWSNVAVYSRLSYCKSTAVLYHVQTPMMQPSHPNKWTSRQPIKYSAQLSCFFVFLLILLSKIVLWE